MPRVNNEATAVANRAIEKFADIISALRAMAEAKEMIEYAKGDTKSLFYRTGSDNLQRIETDLQSSMNTLLGLHEKLVRKDVTSFVGFAEGLILERFFNDADAKHSAQFTELTATSE